MKNLLFTTLSLVLATAITANVAVLFKIGERLTRIETRLDLLTPTPTSTTVTKK